MRDTTPAELRAAPGGPWPSGARGDPASDVAARRLAWQRAFESALRLPWWGQGHLGASADAPSARPALIARPPSASDAVGSASLEGTRGRDVPDPAALPAVGGLAPSPAAPPGAQRGCAAEEDAPRPPRIAEYEVPRLRDASLASYALDSVAPREPGEALASIRGGAENGFTNQATRPGGAAADPRGRSAWVRAPAREEHDPGRVLVPGSATSAGEQRHRATAPARPEPTKPAVAEAVGSPVQVPVSACAGTPLAGLVPGASGPAPDLLEPPLEELPLARELRLRSSGARDQGGAAPAREPVRCHAEWGEDGVRVWIGLDQDREQSQPQLTRALVEQARTLVEAQGGRVLTVICNGKVVWGRRPPAGARSLQDQANRRDWFDGPVDVSSKEEEP